MLTHEDLMARCTGKSTPAARAPSLLAVTSELPWPLDTGGHLRTFHLLRSLAARFRVRLVTSGSVDQEDAVENLRRNGIAVVTAPATPRNPVKEVFRAGAAAARRQPYVLY